MKALFFTVLIFIGAFLGYDYFLAPSGSKVVFKSLNKPAGPPAPSLPATPDPAATANTPAPVVPRSEPAPAAPAAPSVAAPTPPAAAAPAAEPNGFVPPRFEPIEVLTANWTKIPPSAFPRQVKLMRDVEFKMSVGTSKMAAGGTAVALALEQGGLTITPSASSPARAVVPVDATDLKTIIAEGYEKWKPWRTDTLRKLYARKLAAKGSSGEMAAPAGSVDPAGMPVRNPDGSYPLLNASMSSGQVTEVTPKAVHSWSAPTPAQVDGKAGWSIKVTYDANTIFGPMQVEAQALVLNGKVRGWYYTGSGEEVP